jgi:acetate---CoA ligase (ADP-forming) subunit beta
MAKNQVLEEALKKGQVALSEYESKKLLAEYGIPITKERLAKTADEATAAAKEIGYPVVLKACGPEITHKTERELVVVGVRNAEELRFAFDKINTNLGDTPREGVLVQELITGERELVLGLIRDPQFGPCVMFGLGGIFTEILKDTSFRVAPITEEEAVQMMDDIRAKDILGPVRRMAPADKPTLAKALVGLGQIGIEHEEVAEIDVNPLIIAHDGAPVAVDALVVLKSEK